MNEIRQSNNRNVYETRKDEDKKEFIKSCVVFVYKVISVISTLTIFSGLILFIYGNIIDSNTSDNNLIMEQIKKETKEDSIISVNTADIYGFGNESIIVTASNYKTYNKEDYDNKLVILDKIDNEILKKMNDLLGIKSNFKTTHTYSIYCENVCFIPRTRYVIDITGDKTKEIIVQYRVYGSVGSVNGTAIFKYSYDDEKYHIIGTYPNCEKMDLRHDKDGNLLEGLGIVSVETNFSKLEGNSWKPVCFDGEKKFALNNGSFYCKEYWIDCTTWGPLLVIVHVDKYAHYTYINIYNPGKDVDEDDNELKWQIIYSENVEEFSYSYTRDDLAKELVRILGVEVKFLEEIEEW